MKKLRKDYWKAIIGGIILTVFFIYVLASLLMVLFMEMNFNNVIKDPKGVYNWFFVADKEPLLIIGVLSPLFLFFITNKLGLYDNVYQDASKYGVHGTSRWGRIEELKEGNSIAKKSPFNPKNPFKALSNESGLVLGKIPNENELIIVPQGSSVDNRNVLIIGSSGSGKGQAYVYNNVINNREETLVVTDPKGEIFDATHEIKRDQGYDVFLIDFINLNQAKYNPLDYVKKDIDAKKIANSISRNSSKDGKEDFFFNTARDLLTGLIIYCKSKNPKASIPVDVKREFFKASDDEDYLMEICKDIGEEHPAYQYLKDASVADGKTRTSILSSFAQQTAIFSLKDVQEMTKESDFNFYDFQDRKSILYVKIPMKDNPVEPLTATFFDQLIEVFYEIADQNGSHLHLPTNFILDEFANIGRINDYEGTLSTCRGLGISISTIVQGFDQLEHNYGKETARTIINNHDMTLFLKTKDTETAKYLSTVAGPTTARVKTQGSSQTGGIFSKNHNHTKSDNEQYVQRPLITEGEFTNLEKDKAYLFVSGYYPLAIEKAWQFKVYGTFLFDKERKHNYSSWRDKYISKFKLTPIYNSEEDNHEEDTTSANESNGGLEQSENVQENIIEQHHESQEKEIGGIEEEYEPVEIPSNTPSQIDDVLSEFFNQQHETQNQLNVSANIEDEDNKNKKIEEEKINEFIYNAITVGNIFKLEEKRQEQYTERLKNEKNIEEAIEEEIDSLPDDLQFEDEEEHDIEEELNAIIPQKDEVHGFIQTMKSQVKDKQGNQEELTAKTLRHQLKDNFESAISREGVREV